ncbi:MAG: hypothetical protein MUF75_03520 [Bacteroidia bacterium]|jgi:hypothetical protein|nr:hypothetical protein [Bacteroidia bacterium]
MNLKRPNKKLEASIKKEVAALQCPIHRLKAEVAMEDENTALEVKACCLFFKNDVFILAERMRKEFIYKAEKTRERIERERLKGLRNERE